MLLTDRPTCRDGWWWSASDTSAGLSVQIAAKSTRGARGLVNGCRYAARRNGVRGLWVARAQAGWGLVEVPRTLAVWLRDALSPVRGLWNIRGLPRTRRAWQWFGVVGRRAWGAPKHMGAGALAGGTGALTWKTADLALTQCIVRSVSEAGRPSDDTMILEGPDARERRVRAWAPRPRGALSDRVPCDMAGAGAFLPSVGQGSGVSYAGKTALPVACPAIARFSAG